MDFIFIPLPMFLYRDDSRKLESSPMLSSVEVGLWEDRLIGDIPETHKIIFTFVRAYF